MINQFTSYSRRIAQKKYSLILAENLRNSAILREIP